MIFRRHVFSIASLGRWCDADRLGVTMLGADGAQPAYLAVMKGITVFNIVIQSVPCMHTPPNTNCTYSQIQAAAQGHLQACPALSACTCHSITMHVPPTYQVYVYMSSNVSCTYHLHTKCTSTCRQEHRHTCESVQLCLSCAYHARTVHITSAYIFKCR